MSCARSKRSAKEQDIHVSCLQVINGYIYWSFTGRQAQCEAFHVNKLTSPPNKPMEEILAFPHLTGEAPGPREVKELARCHTAISLGTRIQTLVVQVRNL